jgi:hypothetical protein
MYQGSGPPCPIITLKLSLSVQYGQRTVLDGLRAASRLVIVFGPLARLRSFSEQKEVRLSGHICAIANIQLLAPPPLPDPTLQVHIPSRTCGIDR